MHFAESLIEDVLSLKSQLDIEPTELHVPVSDVIEEIDLGAVCFKVCKTGIMFHAKSGYTSWVEARCVSLYTALSEMLAEHKRLSNLTDEQMTADDEQQAENIRLYRDAWIHMLEMPIASSISPMILFPVVTEFLRAFGEETKNMLEQPLHEETAEDLQANAEAEQKEAMLDAMAAQIKE